MIRIRCCFACKTPHRPSDQCGWSSLCNLPTINICVAATSHFNQIFTNCVRVVMNMYVTCTWLCVTACLQKDTRSILSHSTSWLMTRTTTNPLDRSQSVKIKLPDKTGSRPKLKGEAQMMYTEFMHGTNSVLIVLFSRALSADRHWDHSTECTQTSI